MKKILLSFLLVGMLFSFSPVVKAEVQPSQQELTQQLITLLTQLIAQLQQQILDILASQAAMGTTLQTIQSHTQQISTNTTPPQPEAPKPPVFTVKSISFDGKNNFSITSSNEIQTFEIWKTPIIFIKLDQEPSSSQEATKICTDQGLTYWTKGGGNGFGVVQCYGKLTKANISVKEIGSVGTNEFATSPDIKDLADVFNGTRTLNATFILKDEYGQELTAKNSYIRCSDNGCYAYTYTGNSNWSLSDGHY